MGNKVLKSDNEPEAPITPEDLEKFHRKRQAIVNEILSTEKSYVSALRSVVAVWYIPLENAIKSGKPIIKQSEFTAIFSIIRNILELHETLLAEVQDRVSKWTNKQLIGDIFVKHAEALKLYTEYVNNYNNALETVGHCQQKSSAKQFFEEGTEHNLNDQKLDLVSYLIMPIQRIPRYQLLLQDLLRSTRRKHKDYRNIALALDEIVSAATYINEQKRVYEETSKLVAVQQMLNDDYDIIAPHRRVLGDGEFQPLESTSVNATSVHWILCNDILILATIGKGFFSRRPRYNVLLMAPLFDTVANEIPSSKNNAIKIQHKQSVLYFGFETPTFMNSWLKQFEEAKKIAFEVRLLTERTFPKKESAVQTTSPDPHRNSSPVRPNQSVSLGDARRKASAPLRKESAPKNIIVEEEIKPAEKEVLITNNKDKKDKPKEKEKKKKNFAESLREPLLNDKKKNKKDKKSKKKSKKGKKDEGDQQENKCCSCF